MMSYVILHVIYLIYDEYLSLSFTGSVTAIKIDSGLVDMIQREKLAIVDE